jgi:hypothetical protein
MLTIAILLSFCVGTTTTALPEPTAGGVAAGGGEIRIRQRIPSLSNDIDNLDLPLESKAQLDRQRREMKAYIERMKKKEQQEKRNGLSTSSGDANSHFLRVLNVDFDCLCTFV